jgi:sirohydrochlorin cobaltochelatase
VAGDHVQNDILGDDSDSLKSRLNVPDFTCSEALGLRPWVRRRFLCRLEAALVALEEA